MRPATQQRPQETHVAPWHRRDHVHGRVSQTDGEDLGVGRHAQQRLAERQDAATVGRRALRKQHDGLVGVFLEQGGQFDETGSRRRCRLWRPEGSQNRR